MKLVAALIFTFYLAACSPVKPTTVDTFDYYNLEDRQKMNTEYFKLRKNEPKLIDITEAIEKIEER